jgi:hypothetical protein
MIDEVDLFGVSPGPSPRSAKTPIKPGTDRGIDPLPGPVRSLIQNGPGGTPPVPPLERGDTTSILDNTGPVATEVGELELGLKLARDALQSWSMTMASYDKTLSAYWSKKDRLFDQLVNTHGKSMANEARLIYNALGKEERAKLFEASDALAMEYGPILTKRREAALEAKLLQKEVEHINKRLAQLAKRRKK